MTDLQQILISSGFLVAFVEVLKSAGLPSRFAPLVSVIFGVMVAALLNGLTTESLVYGFIYGAMAAGFYSGTKATIGKQKKAPSSLSQGEKT